jgi:hypothetical protein
MRRRASPAHRLDAVEREHSQPSSCATNRAAPSIPGSARPPNHRTARIGPR